jgi:quinoprotein dehydrogenase-associated probable ABC transporter substrate-binding protein
MSLPFRKRVGGKVGRRVSQSVAGFGGLLLAVIAVSGNTVSDLAVYPSTRLPSYPPLLVCADPNNLPFSNQRGEGFENRLAELIARELKTSVSYVWWAQRRGFIRNTLAAGRCDVVMGMPSDLPSVLTTRPYYRSRYVFVSRADRHIVVRSFDDPLLRRLRIGVQVVGDGANTPPMDAFARRGMAKNLVGYTVFGDYAQPSPPARIMEAVSRGDVDIAVVWGPLAGFFADKYAVPLTVTPVPGDGRLPFEFSISLAVRKGDQARRTVLDRLLLSKQAEIEKVLDEYHVPRSKVELSTIRSGS